MLLDNIWIKIRRNKLFALNKVLDAISEIQ